MVNIDIVILIIYCILNLFPIVFINLFLISNTSLSYYFLKRRYNLLILGVFGSFLLGFIELLYTILKLEKDNNYLIKIGFYYLINIPCIIFYIYRGFIEYYNILKLKNFVSGKQENTIKILRNIKFIKITTIIMISLSFVYFFIIFGIYYNKSVLLFNFSILLYYIIVIIYTFILHPLIIYLLFKEKSEIKTDYIITMFSICITFIIFIYEDLIKRNFNYTIQKIFMKYWANIGTTLCTFMLLVLPFFKIVYAKSKPNIINKTITNEIKNREYIILLYYYNEYLILKNKNNLDNMKKLSKLFFIDLKENNVELYNKYLTLFNDINDNESVDKLFENVKNEIYINIYAKDIVN